MTKHIKLLKRKKKLIQNINKYSNINNTKITQLHIFVKK